VVCAAKLKRVPVVEVETAMTPAEIVLFGVSRARSALLAYFEMAVRDENNIAPFQALSHSCRPSLTTRPNLTP
jgi:hypothetical protein